MLDIILLDILKIAGTIYVLILGGFILGVIIECAKTGPSEGMGGREY